MLNDLNSLIQRDLDKLIYEIRLYKNTSDLWHTSREVKNSAGNLSLHLCGNLKHFIGAILGDTGYVRNRQAEFSSKNISLDDIVTNINETKEVVAHSLSTLTTESLEQVYPIEVFGKPMSTQFFLLHLLSHLNYHLGQINYHRRLLD